jgi:hypothetical protein
MPLVLYKMVAKEINIAIGGQQDKFKEGIYLRTRTAEVIS